MAEEATKGATQAAYTIDLEQGSFRFRRPTTQQLDRYLAKAQGKLVSAGKTFTLELVADEDREKWLGALERRPGLSTAVVQEIMQDLGFLGEYTED